ncbi:MAG: methyltransferase [Bacteroidales bacterium]|nr:methyltransferase [Bacteroidales bacterium]
MDQKDKFYTPDHVADRLVGHVAEEEILTVADFCVGDGDLLKAVLRRFPHVRCFGVDISKESIERLKTEHPTWSLGDCDFLERTKVAKLKGIGDRKYDLIVFNPPFSCKGGTLCNIEFEGQAFKCSTALMFLAEALEYLNETGVIYAILPISCLYSQKDKVLWDYLTENHQLKVLEKLDRPYWQQCSPNILLVSLRSNAARAVEEQTKGYDFTRLPITRIVRGTIGMHEAVFAEGRAGKKMIHTTHLHGNKVTTPGQISNGEQYCIKGTAVLIPRVCNPNKGKICIYDDRSAYVLSDCVIALQTKGRKDAQTVFDTLMAHWDDFKEVYNGTGAKYTTLERLRVLFGVKNDK